jgi:hypothetical protein
LFPIGLSNGPPPGSKTPDGRNGLAEVAANGVNFVRTGIGTWDGDLVDAQIAAQRELHAAAAAHGLKCWLWLGDTPNLPAKAGSANEQLLTKIVTAFRGDAALLAWKGYDEPRNPARGANWIRPATLPPYRPAFDITGVDIYPVSYPPQVHSDLKNKDINVIGQLARRTRTAAGTKPFWMTLQIAWSGVVPTPSRPGIVPRFPSLTQERFMAYQAIANGASGLIFFGGHLTTVMTPEDAASGWNWTFWRRVLRPVVSELGSSELAPALAAPTVKPGVKTANRQIELVTRRTATHVYVIAVRTGGAVSRVAFTGLPRTVKRGEVLFEYVQQAPRPITVTKNGFQDWFAPHDVHVYRFTL